jgi:hypothetical protein
MRPYELRLSGAAGSGDGRSTHEGGTGNLAIVSVGTSKGDPMRKTHKTVSHLQEEAIEQPCGVGRALGLDTNELWVDEHSRHRLLNALGQLTLEDVLADSASSSAL